jgi:hypothetical protein
MDPLADPAACARDASLMKKLGMNVIRVYQVRIGKTKFCKTQYSELGRPYS